MAVDPGNQQAIEAMRWFKENHIEAEFSKHADTGKWYAKAIIGPGVHHNVEGYDTPWQALSALRAFVEEAMGEEGSTLHDLLLWVCAVLALTMLVTLALWGGK